MSRPNPIEAKLLVLKHEQWSLAWDGLVFFYLWPLENSWKFFYHWNMIILLVAIEKKINMVQMMFVNFPKIWHECVKSWIKKMLGRLVKGIITYRRHTSKAKNNNRESMSRKRDGFEAVGVFSILKPLDQKADTYKKKKRIVGKKKLSILQNLNN